MSAWRQTSNHFWTQNEITEPRIPCRRAPALALYDMSYNVCTYVASTYWTSYSSVWYKQITSTASPPWEPHSVQYLELLLVPSYYSTTLAEVTPVRQYAKYHTLKFSDRTNFTFKRMVCLRCCKSTSTCTEAEHSEIGISRPHKMFQRTLKVLEYWRLEYSVYRVLYDR